MFTIQIFYQKHAVIALMHMFFRKLSSKIITVE